MDWGGRPGGTYYNAFVTVCMGDLNAVDIAQTTHRQLLVSANCMRPAEELVYGSSVPAAATWEGLYIDDHIVFSVVSHEGLRQLQRWARAHQPSLSINLPIDATARRHAEILNASRAAYPPAGLNRSKAKEFT